MTQAHVPPNFGCETSIRFEFYTVSTFKHRKALLVKNIFRLYLYIKVIEVIKINLSEKLAKIKLNSIIHKENSMRFRRSYNKNFNFFDENRFLSLELCIRFSKVFLQRFPYDCFTTFNKFAKKLYLMQKCTSLFTCLNV